MPCYTSVTNFNENSSILDLLNSHFYYAVLMARCGENRYKMRSTINGEEHTIVSLEYVDNMFFVGAVKNYCYHDEFHHDKDDVDYGGRRIIVPFYAVSEFKTYYASEDAHSEYISKFRITDFDFCNTKLYQKCLNREINALMFSSGIGLQDAACAFMLPNQHIKINVRSDDADSMVSFSDVLMIRCGKIWEYVN